MILDIAQSMSLMIMALLAIVILLRILVIVHKQYGRVKDLEVRMKAIEQLDIDTETTETVEEKES